ncbi:Truncated hemoglobins [hydrothermal vent metagenome]|uniref:Truncated hemoglobins n=1 Tax=hydrothermal vent metagenome TaxID=652676 RepID=A0A1W1C5A5_9ZZZZ
MPANTITRENIETMVMNFYTRVMKDEIVGPFFVAKLGDDMNNEHWRPHLKLLIDFWASIALGDTSYRGNPFAPHMYLGELKRETFAQWLTLFYATLDEVYAPQIAEQFKERSSIIAGNFMRNLGIA